MWTLHIKSHFTYATAGMLLKSLYPLQFFQSFPFLYNYDDDNDEQQN